jgi:hypothetical protein
MPRSWLATRPFPTADEVDPFADRGQRRQVGASDEVAVLPLVAALEAGAQLPALDQAPDRRDGEPHRHGGLRH